MSLIQARISEADKQEFVRILEEAGLDVATALRVYVRTVIRAGEFPFWLMTPNAKTVKAMLAVQAGSGEFEDTEDFGAYLEKVEAEAQPEVPDQGLEGISKRPRRHGKKKKLAE